MADSSNQSHRCPKSCDTFVALPPATADGHIIFAKNSDRPANEVQEVVYFPEGSYEAGTQLECTYITIPQVQHTHAVILSKPAWMWGAEMGANQHGVCIGNEAVWSKLCGPDTEEERLLGMDLLRLGLERGSTAKEALDVMTTLLEQHGQGGPCMEEGGTPWCYDNSFIIADRREAWVLETASRLWAAERITSGCRNISNELSVRTKIDAMSEGLKDHAQKHSYWSPEEGDFDFARAYSQDLPNNIDEDPTGRAGAGKRLMEKYSGSIKAQTMFTILRDKKSGINMDGSFRTTASMVSILPPPDTGTPCCHWFTATPDPSKSVFKPFIFCNGVEIAKYTHSPERGADDPVRIKPRFQSNVDRRHPLYRAHEKAMMAAEGNQDKRKELQKTMAELEEQCIMGMEAFLKDSAQDMADEDEIRELFIDCVETEMKFYK
ncbi:secernin-2-like [Branchiostoma floridae]|uniref:Secernin-2-like n=1 Tax=Branchiostoma floridae TaxID=7739 RepID=C3Z8J7_BRAFL|nr:secernin-2-like [Branchiostoma floridae]XP_035687865.1 secernin-2-like [Branchiostoma floridae]|eukprot:XP_002595091.1 hypothetical protein BRAFLDRAFT_90201 [Branchiostoma floridae]